MNSSIIEPVSVTTLPLELSEMNESTQIQFSFPVNIDNIGVLLYRLVSFIAMKDDCNQEGIVTPSRTALMNAIHFLFQISDLTHLLQAEDIYCTKHGTIVIDLEMQNKLLSVEIGDRNLGYIMEENETIIKTLDKQPVAAFYLSPEISDALSWLRA